MGTIEQDVLECCTGCASNKITERKKSVERLSTLLEDSKTIQLLNRNNSNTSWESVFQAVHILILREAERFKTDEQKGQTSSSSQTNRDNMKIKCSALIDNLVTKSIKGPPRLKCSTVLSYILQILNDPYLQKYFGCTYLLILQSVLTVRKYWGDIKSEEWNDLLDKCFLLYEKPPPGMDKPKMAEILNRIVKCGTCQSHLGLRLRKKFTFLLQALEDPNLHKLPALQASLLKLAITVSQQLAKESRMATCKFGEDVIKSVIGLYEHRLEDRYDKKGLMFDFLLLQMHIHHPCGAREGEGAAYAYDWEKWRSQLKAMCNLVYTEMHNIQRNKNKIYQLRKNFLQLAVEVCKQVFDDQNNVFDVSQMHSLNESTSFPLAKRRRVTAGLQAIMDDLNTPGKTQSMWPWLSLVRSLLFRYPNILKVQEFQSFLHLMAELQNTCKDTVIMEYLCQCCESLLGVEQVMDQLQLNQREVNLLWLKIWETTLRTVGLNQSEKGSHRLLQAMIIHQKTRLPSILVHMYLNGTIQLSEHSLQTLEVILEHCDLPDNVEAFRSIPTRLPSYCTTSQGSESLRCSLLDWMLPNKDDISLSELKLVPFKPCLISKVLVELTVKSECDINNSKVIPETGVDKFVTDSIEEDYMVSSFEMGLLFKDCSKLQQSDNVKTSQSAKLVINSAKNKLIELLKRDCSILTDRVAVPQDSNTKLKILKVYISQCLLIFSTLSWMLKWSIITSHSLPTHSLTDAVRKLMDQLASFAKNNLVTSRMETNLQVVYTVLHETRQLFENDFHEDITKLVQELIPADLVKTVYRVTSLKQPQASTSAGWNKSPFSAEGDDIMEAAISAVVEEASCSLLDVQLLSEREKVQAEAVDFLCSYSCCTKGRKLSVCGSETLSLLLRWLLEEDQPTSSLWYFQMAVAVIRRVHHCSQLEDVHVSLTLKIIQALCRSRYQDHEAAFIIHELFCAMLRHIRNANEKDKGNSLVLLRAFQKSVDVKKKFGPEIIIQYIRCLGKLAEAENLTWAVWPGTPVGNGTEMMTSAVPVAEELLNHVKSPFHVIRMMAARYIGILFSSQNGAGLSAEQHNGQKKMFDTLCLNIISSFIVEDNLTMEEKVDESANRTASALHCFAALIVVSSLWRKKALFAIFQLVKEKNLNIELVQKVLTVIGKSLKLPNYITFLDSNLSSILTGWKKMQYSLEEFPWALLDCTSDTDFYNKYQEVIVPLLIKKEDNESLELVSQKVGKTLAALVEMSYPRIIACLVPCFAEDVSDDIKDADVRMAKRLLEKLDEILTKDKITDLLNHQLDKVIVNIMRLMFDPHHFSDLFGSCQDTLSEPDAPYFKFSTIMKSLQYLQDNSPKPDVSLVLYLAKESPLRVHKILLCLAVDIHQAPVLEDKLKSLHRYAAFAHILVTELGVSGVGLGDMATFIIRDVSHTLIHLVKHAYQERDFALAVAACHFYRLFCTKCFPAFASVVQSFLVVIVNILVPLAKFSGDLGVESQLLLRFLVVENSEHLTSAIELLDPFPDDTMFQEIQEIYTRIKQTNRMDTLDDCIKHFLAVGNRNLGCRAEGLKHLRSQLSKRKQELCLLYGELNDMRGFSEDCARSLLHQLIWMLVELTSVSDSGISLEASRCLGELGPADLITMVLKPEKSQELQENGFSKSPIMMFTAHIVELLVEYLVDEKIDVVEATSAALSKILASREGQKIIDSNKIDKNYIIPFIVERKRKRDCSLVIDEEMFRMKIGMENLWCPLEECTHGKWVTDLVCSILETFSKDGCFISDLIPVCNVKVSFAEHILPLLVVLVLSTGSELCCGIMNKCICYFFRQHFEKSFQFDKERSTSPPPVLKHCKKQVCFNRASVQCMLNVVNYARLRKYLKPSERKAKASTSCQYLELNYLHVAQAAQFCSAYFTSILYAELWCDDTREGNDAEYVAGQSLSALEYICDKNLMDGVALQNILKEAYIKIGDSDAVYGCGSSHVLDPRTRIRHYEQVGNWQSAVVSYDLELSNGNEDATGGMLHALQRLGVHHLLNGYLGNELCSEYEEYQYECCWRLGQWNLLSTENSKKSYFSNMTVKNSLESLIVNGEYEKYHYMSLKAMHNLDFTGVDKAVTTARQCVIDSLKYASLESSKSLYPALSQLQALQEIEDFVSEWKKSRNLEVVLEKWKKQSQLNLNEFQYVEPVLAQRAVLLHNAVLVEKNTEMVEGFGRHLAEVQLSTAKLARMEGWYNVGARCLRMLSEISSSVKVERQVKLEEAQLCWERGDREIGRRLLRHLLGELSLIGDRSEVDRLLYSSSLKLYGNWMVETKSENPQAIVERYFLKALRIIEGVPYKEESQLETYTLLARFVDAEYQQLMGLLKSPAYETKQQFMTKAREEAHKLMAQKNRTRDEERNITMRHRMINIEQAEVENTEKDKDMYLKLAMKYYLLSLEHGIQHSLQVFRLTSLWLENTAHEGVSEVLEEHLSSIPSYKFLSVLPQLTPHISNNTSDPFIRKLNALLECCAVEHPHHTLPLILALANSYSDQEFIGGSRNARNSEPRVLGAQQMVQSLKKDDRIKSVLVQMEQVARTLITLAYYSPENRTQSVHTYPVPKEVKKQLVGKEMVAVPTLTIPVKTSCQYDDIIGIYRYEEEYNYVGGINAPKKILCTGTDGIVRPQLVKGQDDLRQDAVMQQVFTIMNTLLKNNKETKKRKLLIRTYKVVPLSQRSGVLEWCLNTEPLSAYLIGREGAHRRYYPQDLTSEQCRKQLIAVAGASNEKKLEVYNSICKQFHPAFRYFFLENFLTPGVWFERRLAYIHSVATSSMIGYILGLGDRHTVNILVDKSTAEFIHIDFGIAFEQGHILPTPETVPFRLTRDVEDGMGVSGIEGVFRRCCEKTMTVLRQNQETILTILEVLLYDPLYAWTISPSKAFNMQQRNHPPSTSSSDSEATECEVNKMAERALIRLRQKLQGTEEGTSTSVDGQVNRLLQQARDPVNLSRLYHGWQPFV